MVSYKKLFDGISVEKIKNQRQNMLFNAISFNSKEIGKNDIYFCFEGTNFDGRDFVIEAKNNGATAVVSNKELDIDICQIIVKDTRSAFALASKNFYNKVCDSLKIVGVCGTNGKTTTSSLINHILNNSGQNSALIGTNGAFWNGKSVDFSMTTPDSNVLHKLFFDMKNDGVDFVVMEVSAHSIALKKLEGINFAVGVMTNVTEDHLDFFGTFENYAKTKIEFMNSPSLSNRVVNFDDKILRENVNMNNLATITYGQSNPSDCFVAGVNMDIKGSSFVLNFVDNIFDISTKLCGKYNIDNILASFCCCSILGVEFTKIQEGIATFEGVEGRFNVYSSNKGFDVIIDFAHTPDGLKNVLVTAGGITSGKLICVFGCGGNRDKQKRPIMASIAEKYSDFVVVTSDNPRFENPEKIIDEVCLGFSEKYWTRITDRKSAIQYAISIAQPRDVVIICGKGAENYIEVEGKKIPFSDKKVIKEFL